MATALSTIIEFLDERIDIDCVPDASLNGLQLEAVADGPVARVALAVDAAAATIDAAIDQDCDLMLVHHGLFWGGPEPLVGAHGGRVRRCYEGGLSVYAAHLPLDLHGDLGNNALLARALGAEPCGTFGAIDGVEIGVVADLGAEVTLSEVAARLAAAGCDDQTMWCFGDDPLRRLAVVTGAGCGFLQAAVRAGAQCFITGEPRQAAYHEAREARMNCLFAGHYATEVFGVRAVGALLEDRFGLETVWIDHPTGV